MALPKSRRKTDCHFNAGLSMGTMIAIALVEWQNTGEHRTRLQSNQSIELGKHSETGGDVSP